MNSFSIGVLLTALVIGVVFGLILNFRTKFLHFRLIGQSRLVFPNGTAIGAMNVMAVIWSVTFFGAGSIVWLWVTSILLMSAAFCERTLSAYFRKKTDSGEWLGGVGAYMRDGIGSRFGSILAVIFTILFALLAVFGGGVLQTASVSTIGASLGISPIILPIVLTLICAAILFLGSSKNAILNNIISLVGIILLITASVAAIITGYNRLSAVFGEIFTSCLSAKAIIGGIISGTICSLSGFGISALDNSKETEPVRAGLSGVASVGISSIILGTLIALGALFSGKGFGFNPSTGECFLTEGSSLLFKIAIIIVALASMLGWAKAARSVCRSVIGEKCGFVCSIIFLIISVCCSTRSLSAVWEATLILSAIVFVLNMLALLVLSKTVSAVARNFIKRRINGDTTIQPMLSYYPDTQYLLEKEN